MAATNPIGGGGALRNLLPEDDREGLVDVFNGDRAGMQFLSSQNDFADAETEIATDLVGLYRALGGGWDVVHRPGAFDHPAPVGPPGAIPMLIHQANR